jgi:hypothetical protein
MIIAVLCCTQGPLTEEFVFRSCMVPLLVCAEFTVKQIVLGSPLMFGAGRTRGDWCRWRFIWAHEKCDVLAVAALSPLAPLHGICAAWTVSQRCCVDYWCVLRFTQRYCGVGC